MARVGSIAGGGAVAALQVEQGAHAAGLRNSASSAQPVPPGRDRGRPLAVPVRRTSSRTPAWLDQATGGDLPAAVSERGDSSASPASCWEPPRRRRWRAAACWRSAPAREPSSASEQCPPRRRAVGLRRASRNAAASRSPSDRRPGPSRCSNRWPKASRWPTSTTATYKSRPETGSSLQRRGGGRGQAARQQLERGAARRRGHQRGARADQRARQSPDAARFRRARPALLAAAGRHRRVLGRAADRGARHGPAPGRRARQRRAAAAAGRALRPAGAPRGAGARPGRQGHHLRHRRHLDQAGRRHGADEGRHGRRRGRRRRAARHRRSSACRCASSPSCRPPRTCRADAPSSPATCSAAPPG